MFKTIKCTFFPDCFDRFDREECFFEHIKDDKQSSEQNLNRKYCVNGQNCSDQACTYGVSAHKDIKSVLCRFQANCKRENCF